jgi:hypothetical protein
MFGRSKSERCSAEDEQPSPQTQVLPDLPDEEEPLAYAGPPHTRSLRRRIAAAAAAIALAAVMAGGGLLGAYSLSGNAPASGHHAFGGVVLTPAFLAHLRSASTPAKPAPAKSQKSPKKPAPARTRSLVRAARAALVVKYRIDDDSGNGFTAEVDVTNDGSAPVTTWELVLALPGDHFTSWWNASGQASNGILLLTQPDWQGPVAGHGGRLRVYLNVTGDRGTPAVCSVNGIRCGRA